MNSQVPAAASANKLPETKAALHSPAPDRTATMGWQTMPPTLPPVLRTPAAAALAVGPYVGGLLIVNRSYTPLLWFGVIAGASR
jgi:hypothetical protein